jgi:hypothetical protein
MDKIETCAGEEEEKENAEKTLKQKQGVKRKG